MAIRLRDVKTLWGISEGRCSYPNCGLDLIPFLDTGGPTIVGQMAHVIGRMPGAARSDSEIGIDDSYENLILLCPTHHTLIDKSPLDFPETRLRKWKAELEDKRANSTPVPENRTALFHEIRIRLIANGRIFEEWGPNSERAKNSPQSFQAAEYWEIRKSAVILPNNDAIAKLIKNYTNFLDGSEISAAFELVEHIEFYRQHCLEPVDSTGYMPFPNAFSKIVLGDGLNVQ